MVMSDVTELKTENYSPVL